MTTYREALHLPDEKLHKLGTRHLLALYKQSRYFGGEWEDRSWYVESGQEAFNKKLKGILACRPHVPRTGLRRTSIRQERLHGKKNLKY